MKFLDIDMMGEDAKELAKIRKRNKPKSYKFHRVCFMFVHRKKKGLVQPSYCSGEFDTNKEKKVNCSAFCSLDYNYVRRKERGHG